MTEILATGVSECLGSASLLAWPSGLQEREQGSSLEIQTSEPQEAAASQLGNREIQGAQRGDPQGPPSTLPPTGLTMVEEFWNKLSSHFCSELLQTGHS